MSCHFLQQIDIYPGSIGQLSTMASTPEKYMIKLNSSDGEQFEIGREAIKLSNTLNNLLQDCGRDDASDEEKQNSSPIPLPNVDAATLKMVIRYLEYHEDDRQDSENAEPREKSTHGIQSWDVEFLKVDQVILFSVLKAANCLDIKGLLDLTCQTIANMIKGKSPEEIRRTFNIKNDFTAEEEEQMRKENAWREES